MALKDLCGVGPLLFRRKNSKEEKSHRHHSSRKKPALRRVPSAKRFPSSSSSPIPNPTVSSPYPSYIPSSKHHHGKKHKRSSSKVENLVTVTKIREKTLQFRDIVDLPPCLASTSVTELLMETLKDLHELYPNVVSTVSISELEGTTMYKALALFCGAMKSLEDTWMNKCGWAKKRTSTPFTQMTLSELEKNVLVMLDEMIMLGKDKMLDMMDDDDQMRDDISLPRTSPDSNNTAFSRVLSESESFSDKMSFCGSPATPTSVLPERTTKTTTKTSRNNSSKSSSYSPPLLLPLRVRAVGKLNPIDLKRLSFHMFPYIATQIPNKQPQINLNQEEEEENKDDDHLVVEDTSTSPVSPPPLDLVVPLETEDASTSSVSPPPSVDLVVPLETEDGSTSTVLPLPLELVVPLETEDGSTSTALPPPLELVVPLETEDGSTSTVLPPPLELVVPMEEEVVMETLPSPNAVSTPPLFLPSDAIPPPPPPPPPPFLLTKSSQPPSPSTSAPPILLTSVSLPSPPHCLQQLLPPPPPPPPRSSSLPVLTREPPPPPPPTNAGGPPPPPPLIQGGAPPPPPSLAGGRSTLKAKATKLKRSSQMGNLYRVLKVKVEGSTNLDRKQTHGRKGKPAASNGSGKQGMADALAEMTKRSAYYQQIEGDVKNHAEAIQEVKIAITNFQVSNMDELLKFHLYVESHLEKLTDESQVLARFEGFPGRKLEALRMAASLYSKLHVIETTLKNWKLEGTLSQLLDKAENYFNKIKGELDALERTKDDEAKKFKSHGILFDFMILQHIKEHLVDLSSNCLEIALKEKLESSKENQETGQKVVPTKVLWKTFQFAFRIYTFAGGQDERADRLTRELARAIECDPL